MPKIVMGIDPGYGHCGFAVLSGSVSQPKIQTYGVIATNPKHELPQRLQELADDFQQLLDTHRPEKVVCEELYFAKNVTTGLKVAQAQGVISLLASRQGIPVEMVSPREVKQTFTGDGGADKPAMRQMYRQIFSTNAPARDDAIDALAVAFWGLGQR